MILNNLQLIGLLALQATSICRVNAFVCRPSSVVSFTRCSASPCPAIFRSGNSVGPLFNDYLDSLEENPTEEATAAAAEASTEEVVKIYIGNLPYDENKANIRKLFEPYGRITDVFLPLNRETGQGRGFGFVAMSDRAAAAKAIEELNESSFGDRVIYVNEAGEKPASDSRKPKVPRTKLYVGNVSFETQEEDLKEYFKQFGTVYDCYIPRYPGSGNPRGFAFVTMDNAEAEAAIENSNGTEFNGRSLTVTKSMSKKEKMEKQDRKPETTKVYVGNLSYDTSEDSIREMFEEYGDVLDVYMPFDRDYDRSRGFAFVTMQAEAAEKAIDDADGRECDGRVIRVNAAQTNNRNKRSRGNDGYDGDSWGN